MSGVQELTPQGRLFVWQYLGFLPIFIVAPVILNLLHNDSAPLRTSFEYCIRICVNVQVFLNV